MMQKRQNILRWVQATVILGMPTLLLQDAAAQVHTDPQIARQPDLQIARQPDLQILRLKAKLREQFDGNFVGYAVAIAKDGAVRSTLAGGWGRRPGDGNKKMSADMRVNIASVSKTITAMAVLQLIEKNGITLTTKIAPYLPKDWERGPGFRSGDSLTFQQLLTHTSGLDQKFNSLSKAQQDNWGNDWDGLKYVVRIGTSKADIGKRKYKNANFALFRIIVPILWMKSKNASWDHISEANHGLIYASYVYDHIFKPAGINPVSCEEVPRNGLSAAGYDITNPRRAGVLWNVDHTGCGAHGHWHMSMRELATVATLANCANHDKVPASKRLLSKVACFVRNVRRLGWSPNSNGPRQRWKKKYWHRGDLFSPKSPPRRALHSCIMSFPGAIDVAAIVTSDAKSGSSSVCRRVLNAWQAM